jgi:hypothetical protein
MVRLWLFVELWDAIRGICRFKIASSHHHAQVWVCGCVQQSGDDTVLVTSGIYAQRSVTETGSPHRNEQDLDVSHTFPCLRYG